MNSALLICEACKAPRTAQATVCTACGYRFKTQPVPTYPAEAAPVVRQSHAPTIVESQAPPSMPRMPPPIALPPPSSNRWMGPTSGPQTKPSPIHGVIPPAPPSMRRKSGLGILPWLFVMALVGAGVGVFFMTR